MPTLTLRTIGKKLANAIIEKAVDILVSGSSSFAMAGASVVYTDIINLYGKFSDFNMDIAIVSPSVSAKILSMSAMQDCHFDDNGIAYFPFGASMLVSSQVDDDKVIGIDSKYALEMISTADLVLETDKMIDKQLDSIAGSVFAGFKKFMSGAVRVLDLV